MNGQMTKSERDKVVKDYIKRVDPYTKKQIPKFDMRGYANYLEQNNIRGNEVTPEIMSMFAI